MSQITVGELREMLDRFDDDMLVVVCSDAEGNTVSPLSDVGDSSYIPTTTWYGELVEPDELEELSLTTDISQVQDVLVLWPTQ